MDFSISMIVANEGPMLLEEGSKLVLHIVPYNAFNPSTRYDVAHLMGASALEPMGAAGWGYRHNLDGILSHAPNATPEMAETYLQVFRNGSIETVNTRFVGEDQGRSYIPSIGFEEELLAAVPRFITIQRSIGVEPPFAIMVSMLGVRRVSLGIGDMLLSRRGRPIDRDSLLLPEVIAEDFDFVPTELMRPIFDSVWNATGYPRSLNYSDEGKWGEGPNSRR
jgi:hypothetical protein